MTGASGRWPDAGDLVRLLPAYRIERLLGQGSMGVVYLAEDVRMQRKVALKVLAPALADDQLFRRRFNHESRRAAQLNHPNVVAVYEAGETDGLYYIAMHYVDGGDLGKLLEAGGPLSLERATSFIAQIAAALDAVHAEGLVHRDVKPANILISGREGQEHCCLGDFSITKHLSSGTNLTVTGQFIGTLDYIAPEQIEGKSVDGRADLYALGCVLYQCLTGTVPFKRDGTVALLWAHVHDQPPPVTTHRPDLPPEIDRVVAQAMAKQPEDRYGTCGELVLALRAAAIGQAFDGSGTVTPSVLATNRPIPQPGLSGMTSTYALPRRPPARVAAPSLQRRRWPLIIGTALVLVLVGVLSFVGGSFLKARFPNDAETALLAVVPQALQQSCERDDAEEGTANVKASLVCASEQGANQVVFKKFTSPKALDSAYKRAVNSSGVKRDTGNCVVADQAEHAYTSNTGRLSGRVLCYHERGSSYIMWTESEHRSPTLISARRNDRDYAHLRDWWAGVIDRQVPV
ncbi:MAG: serine/threonine protein kinase, partial [Actinobacteria bacterium]|nr:serine/threonine protein kinase [Actinomycetota bacterium]